MDIELNLNDYWRILVKRKWNAVFAFLATFLSTVVYTQFQLPLYRAQAMIKFDVPTTKMLGTELPSFDIWTAIQTQITLVNSSDMTERVAKKLGVAVGKVNGAYTAERLEQSNLITISATGWDPKATTDLTNAVAEAYVERDYEERSQESRQTLKEVSKRIQEEEEALKDLEEKRKRFLEEHPSSGFSSLLASRLIDLEAQKRELLKKFTPNHPDVLKLDQQIDAAKGRLMRMPGQDVELERLNRDIKVHEEVYITLARQMQQARMSLASTVPWAQLMSRATVPRRPISPNKRINFTLGATMGVFLGIFIAFLLESLDISISTIEEIEKVVGVPVLGIIPHFGLENRWEVLKAKLLRKQRYSLEGTRSLMVFHHRDKSPFIEVYHSLRANIQSQLSRQAPIVLTFTSTGVAEGKSLTAINFCLAAAHAGLRTVLIGADIRRPVIHRIFGLSKQPGFMEVLTGKCGWEDAVQGTVDFLMGELDLDDLLSYPGIDNFKVMTGWTANTADAMNILSSPELPKMIDDLRRNFDIVVFDCPPVLLFADAILIASHTDGVVLVYKSGKMPRAALKRAKDQLVSAKAHIVGVALNDVHATQMEPKYGYYDYGHYAKKEETK